MSVSTMPLRIGEMATRVSLGSGDLLEAGLWLGGSLPLCSRGSLTHKLYGVGPHCMYGGSSQL